MILQDIVQIAAQYTGLVSSAATLALGVLHLCQSEASIKWPAGSVGFIDDVQQVSWRQPMFTFQPDKFFDLWTPVAFGACGILAHTCHSDLCRKITSNYMKYGTWLLFQCLFANFGYRGGFGILIGVLSLLASLFAFIAFFLTRSADGSLNFKRGAGGSV